MSDDELRRRFVRRFWVRSIWLPVSVGGLVMRAWNFGFEPDRLLSLRFLIPWLAGVLVTLGLAYAIGSLAWRLGFRFDLGET